MPHTPRHVAVAIVYSPPTHRILMITSRKHPHLWILPKGGVEKGESSGQAAVRESWEEAGTPRDIEAPADLNELLTLSLEPSKSKNHSPKRGSVWHVHVVRVAEDQMTENSTWPEAHERQREWFTPEEALNKVKEWYSDPGAKEDLDGEAGIENDTDKGSGGTKKGKKAQKGGAMQLALERFLEIEKQL